MENQTEFTSDFSQVIVSLCKGGRGEEECGESAFTGYRVLAGEHEKESSGDGWWRWLYNHANIFNNTKQYT